MKKKLKLIGLRLALVLIYIIGLAVYTITGLLFNLPSYIMFGYLPTDFVDDVIDKLYFAVEDKIFEIKRPYSF